MDLLQEWMFNKVDEWFIKGLTGDLRSTKATVRDESAAIVARLDGIDQKVDEILAELRQMKQS
jgi:hypothetical protein